MHWSARFQKSWAFPDAKVGFLLLFCSLFSISSEWIGTGGVASASIEFENSASRAKSGHALELFNADPALRNFSEEFEREFRVSLAIVHAGSPQLKRRDAS